MKARKSPATFSMPDPDRAAKPSPTNRRAMGSSSTGGRSASWCAARRIATPKSGFAGPAGLHEVQSSVPVPAAAVTWRHDLDWMGLAFRSVCRRHCLAGQGGRGACRLKPRDRRPHQRCRAVCVGHCAWRSASTTNSAQLDRRTVLFLVLSGLATGLSWLCYFRALQLGPASRVAPLDKLSVPLVMVFAWLLLGEKLTGRRDRRRPADHRGCRGDGAGSELRFMIRGRICFQRVPDRTNGAPAGRAARIPMPHRAHRVHGVGQDHRGTTRGGPPRLAFRRCRRRDRRRHRNADRRNFARHGEPAFRDREHATIARLASEDALVLALGGGAIEARSRANCSSALPARSRASGRGARHDPHPVPRDRSNAPVLADHANLAARYERRAAALLIGHRAPDDSGGCALYAGGQVAEAIARGRRILRSDLPRDAGSDLEYSSNQAPGARVRALPAEVFSRCDGSCSPTLQSLHD